MSTSTNDQAINGLKDALGITNDITRLESKIDALVAEIKGAKTKPASTPARLEHLEVTVVSMTTTLEALTMKVDLFGENATANQKAGWADEINRLDGSINSAFGELRMEIQRIDTELAAVKTTVAGHGTRLDGHDTALNRVASMLEETVGRVTIVGENAARAHTRIDNLRLIPGYLYGLFGAAAALVLNVLWHDNFKHWNNQWNAFHWSISIVAFALIGAGIGSRICGDVEASATATSTISARWTTWRNRNAAPAAPLAPPAPPTQVLPAQPAPAPVAQNT